MQDLGKGFRTLQGDAWLRATHQAAAEDRARNPKPQTLTMPNMQEDDHREARPRVGGSEVANGGT